MEAQQCERPGGRGDAGGRSPLSPSFLLAESGMMNGPDLGSTAPSPAAQDEQAASGRDEKENNPFAEYMWMENEEDFNRQVRAGRAVSAAVLRLAEREVPCGGTGSVSAAAAGPAPGGGTVVLAVWDLPLRTRRAESEKTPPAASDPLRALLGP